MSPQLRNIAQGYARRYLARADDADDAASDAMLRLWAVHDSLRDTAHAARLAAVIARNVAIDMLRRQHPTSISGDEAHTSWLLQQESDNNTPESQLEWKEDEQWLRQRIEHIRHQQGFGGDDALLGTTKTIQSDKGKEQNMTDRQIISLLKRYMDGATTVEEETALADFFCTATDADRPDAISAADWSAYREMFCMFAPEQVENGLLNETAAPTVQRFTLRNTLLWVASAAAVAVLVFAVSALLPDNTPSGQSSGAPLAQQAARLVPADSIADSISAEQPQRILADSVKQQPEKRRLHKSVRPYRQPRPPKVYVTEADKNASTRADSTDIEEAVRQADILLHAINANQSAEINQLELQAMELFEADDAEADEYEPEATGNSIQQ